MLSLACLYTKEKSYITAEGLFRAIDDMNKNNNSSIDISQLISFEYNFGKMLEKIEKRGHEAESNLVFWYKY